MLCGNFKNGTEIKKCVLKNDRAVKLYNSSRKLKDSEVFRRTSNISNVDEFIALKLKYHNSC